MFSGSKETCSIKRFCHLLKPGQEKHKFYYVPVSQIKDECFPVRYVALYQSYRLFNTDAGIRYYGTVKRATKTKRRNIHVLPKDSDEMYYLFEIKEWKTLSKPVAIREHSMGRQFTNMFLLEHSAEAPELGIRNETEFRLFNELKRALNSTEINDSGSDIGFTINNSTIIFEDGKIHIYHDKAIRAEYEIKEFSRTPNAVFRRIQNSLMNMTK